ncbi:MAG: sulfatase-like hydrolase/transferase, partial [Gammaproteobacteria bacterium]|nr:sulfatase-like hydrolase/transferase [Gammaproteobacteria bacterium]NIX87405.1 sulfatase-like hydrolase/transferase [Gammaproteobacteria bacterium]
LYPDRSDLYFTAVRSSTSYASGLILLSGMAVSAWAVFQIVRTRFGRRTRIIAIYASVPLILVTPLDFLRRSLDLTVSRIEAALIDETLVAAVVIALVLAAAVGVAVVAVRSSAVTIKLIQAVLIVLAPLAVWNLVQLSWYAVSPDAVKAADGPSANVEAVSRPAAGTAARPGGARARVVWLLIDELDYRLLFEARPQGLELPALDRLRGNAFFATQAQQVGGNTLEAIPKLLTGIRMEQAKAAGQTLLLVKPEDADEFKDIRAFDHIFRALAARRMRMAAVGFYHPYCRLFRAQLRWCQDNFFATVEYARATSLSQALADQARSITPLFRRQNFIEILERSTAAAKALAADRELDFVFLHVAHSHDPAVFDAETRTFSSWRHIAKTVQQGPARYFDGAVLADLFVAELIETMEAAGSWSSTTLILTTDHPWRSSPRYDGEKDRRVPFIVKFAGKRRGLEFSQPFDSIITKALVLALLDGEIDGAQDLAGWIRRYDPAANSSQQAMQGVPASGEQTR